jgi:Matrixin
MTSQPSPTHPSRFRSLRRAPAAALPAALAAAALLLAAAPATAGGFLDAAAMLDGPSPYPGYFLAESVPIFHDVRCIPAPYFLNDTVDPLPNPLGAPFLSLADAAGALEASLAAWNDIPTSFIDLELVGTTDNPGYFQTFDTVNELHFKTPPGVMGGAIASSPSVTLAADMNLAAGTDLDGDGDSDVAAGITVCADVDGDGDWEWPEGFYKAGTILDNDIWFNTGAVRFTVDPAAADTNTRSVDLQGVATHELGHSVGLAHSALNLIGPADGTPATMYPFADTGDPVNELAMRSLEADDVSYAALAYPEGTAASGPAALGPGDVAFSSVYGVIEGEVRHGVLDHAVAGASVSAVDRRTGNTLAATYSGSTSRFYNDPVTFDIILLPGLDSVTDGRYRLPVPTGLYDVRIEPMDDFPVPGYYVSYPGWVGYLLGMLDFHEEAWNWLGEDVVEPAPGRSVPVPVIAGHTTSGIDFTTNVTAQVANFGTWDWVLYSDAPPGSYYAVRIPGEQVLAAAGGEHFALQSADFFTYVLDNSTLPLFAEAMLTTGRALPDGTAEVDLDHPLAGAAPFLAQEYDFAPLYFPLPSVLGRLVENGIRHGTIDSLFLVLRVPTSTPYPGTSGFAPVIGIDGPYFGFNDVPVYGLSYRSFDGVTFFQDDWNYMFRLSLSALR